MKAKATKKAHKSQSKKNRDSYRTTCEINGLAFYIKYNGSNKVIACENAAMMKKLMKDEDVILAVTFDDAEGNECQLHFAFILSEKGGTRRDLCAFSTYEDDPMFGPSAVRFVEERFGASLSCFYDEDENAIGFVLENPDGELLHDRYVLQKYAAIIA